MPSSSSIDAPGWSRSVCARCTTTLTPRSALRNDGGSARSPSASWTRRGCGRSGRGSGTRQRPGVPAATSRSRRARPTTPVAPVSRSIGGGAYRGALGRLPCPPPTAPQRGTQQAMAYVIAEPCIGTKDNSCVEVCPVDCIHPTPEEPDYDKVEQLYINPEECIDCDACVEACPVDACFAEDQLPDEWQRFAEVNVQYFQGR